MPELHTVLDALYRYESEHGTLAAIQLMREAFDAAAASLPRQMPKRLTDIRGVGGEIALEVIGKTAWFLNEKEAKRA